MPAGTAVGVAHDLPSGDTCIGKAAAGHKSPGRIHQHSEIFIQTAAFSHILHDPFAEMEHILRFHVFLVLHAH